MLARSAGVHKAPWWPPRLVLAYPNLYHLAMSNLGFQAAYRINDLDRVVCERKLSCPEPRRPRTTPPQRLPCSAWKSQRPVRDFDVLALALSKRLPRRAEHPRAGRPELPGAGPRPTPGCWGAGWPPCSTPSRAPRPLLDRRGRGGAGRAALTLRGQAGRDTPAQGGAAGRAATSPASMCPPSTCWRTPRTAVWLAFEPLEAPSESEDGGWPALRRPPPGASF